MLNVGFESDRDIAPVKLNVRFCFVDADPHSASHDCGPHCYTMTNNVSGCGWATLRSLPCPAARWAGHVVEDPVDLFDRYLILSRRFRAPGRRAPPSSPPG